MQTAIPGVGDAGVSNRANEPLLPGIAGATPVRAPNRPAARR
ncbi:MAG: hypothetical protein WCK55_02485 [Verrucomicrobiota bacterium]